MNRREFIAGLGSAAAWPVVARAQQPAMPAVGFLHSGSPAQFAHLVAVFRKVLNDAGFVEGRNVAVEYRWALGQYGRLSAPPSRYIFDAVPPLLKTTLGPTRMQTVKNSVNGSPAHGSQTASIGLSSRVRATRR
jgi:putative tryptophan/tyrosine transport system substrate-binding protein